MSNKNPTPPKHDLNGRAIAEYKAAVKQQVERAQSFTEWLRERTANHFGSATPTMTGPMSQLWETP